MSAPPPAAAVAKAPPSSPLRAPPARLQSASPSSLFMHQAAGAGVVPGDAVRQTLAMDGSITKTSASQHLLPPPRRSPQPSATFPPLSPRQSATPVPYPSPTPFAHELLTPNDAGNRSERSTPIPAPRGSSASPSAAAAAAAAGGIGGRNNATSPLPSPSSPADPSPLKAAMAWTDDRRSPLLLPEPVSSNTHPDTSPNAKPTPFNTSLLFDYRQAAWLDPRHLPGTPPSQPPTDHAYSTSPRGRPHSSISPPRRMSPLPPPRMPSPGPAAADISSTFPRSFSGTPGLPPAPAARSTQKPVPPPRDRPMSLQALPITGGSMTPRHVASPITAVPVTYFQRPVGPVKRDASPAAGVPMQRRGSRRAGEAGTANPVPPPANQAVAHRKPHDPAAPPPGSRRTRSRRRSRKKSSVRRPFAGHPVASSTGPAVAPRRRHPPPPLPPHLRGEAGVAMAKSASAGPTLGRPPVAEGRSRAIAAATAMARGVGGGGYDDEVPLVKRKPLGAHALAASTSLQEEERVARDRERRGSLPVAAFEVAVWAQEVAKEVGPELGATPKAAGVAPVPLAPPLRLVIPAVGGAGAQDERPEAPPRASFLHHGFGYPVWEKDEVVDDDEDEDDDDDEAWWDMEGVEDSGWTSELDPLRPGIEEWKHPFPVRGPPAVEPFFFRGDATRYARGVPMSYTGHAVRNNSMIRSNSMSSLGAASFLAAVKEVASEPLEDPTLAAA
ncbi:hypothetical protein HDU96_008353 [Phlyctochytrium bullatum]|nr:hypothetical protein HDU96_008353 [Phlyctochytrium bullatum]